DVRYSKKYLIYPYNGCNLLPPVPYSATPYLLPQHKLPIVRLPLLPVYSGPLPAAATPRRLFAIGVIPFLWVRLSPFLNVPRHPLHNQVFEFTIDPLLPTLRPVLVVPQITIGQLPGQIG